MGVAKFALTIHVSVSLHIIIVCYSCGVYEPNVLAMPYCLGLTRPKQLSLNWLLILGLTNYSGISRGNVCYQRDHSALFSGYSVSTHVCTVLLTIFLYGQLTCSVTNANYNFVFFYVFKTSKTRYTFSFKPEDINSQRDNNHQKNAYNNSRHFCSR